MESIESILKCPICHELFRTAMIIPQCSHNFCSLCIRRSLDLEQSCPICRVKPVCIPDIKNNRLVDDVVLIFRKNTPDYLNNPQCPICTERFRDIESHVEFCLSESERTKKKTKLANYPTKPIAKLCYSILSDKQLKKILTEIGLPSFGDKQMLSKRHSDYVLLYNSECDSLNPLSIPEIIQKVVEMESIRNREKKINFSTTQDLLKHAEEYKEEYKILIEKAKASLNKDQSAYPGVLTMSQPALPFYMQFSAGAIAGVSEILTMYPLDVAKTRLQLQVGTGGNDGYNSLYDCFKKIIKQEGFSRLYRGILAPILIEAPKRATKFAANEQYGNLLKELFKVDKLNQPLSIMTGVGAGVTEAVIIVPFELVKIRMQDKKNAGLYASTWDCISKIHRQEGLLAFYKGLESTLWRHATWNGGYFGVIHFVRQSLPDSKTKEGILLKNFVAGAIGGTVGTILNTPFDVVKTRIQNQLPNAIQKYSWTWPAVFTILREEGAAALYKGFVPKVLRLGPGGGILLVVFDQVTSLMKQYL